MSARTSRLKAGSLAFDTLILGVSAIIAKAIGAVYRIPLTNILGAEGIGLYQLVFPVYALFLTLSSGAIPSALARIIGSRGEGSNPQTTATIYKACNRIMLLLGGGLALLLLALSSPIALSQGYHQLRYGYYIIAPAIVVVALSNCIKGYFQGNMIILPTAISQVVEQLAKLVLGLTLATLLISNGVFSAVLGSILGVLVAEAISLCVLAVQYYRHPRIKLKLPKKISLGYYRVVGYVTIPILLSGLFFPITQFFDSLVIVNMLKLSGVDSILATSQYGILSGSVMTLINMPVVIVLSIATAIMPYMAREKAKRNCYGIANRANKAISFTNRLAMPIVVGIVFLSQPIINTLYPSLSQNSRELATVLMQLAAITIAILCNMQLYSALLQGLGRGKIVAAVMLTAAIAKVGLTVLLVRYLGIRGAVYASLIVYFGLMLVNYFLYSRLMGAQVGLWRELTISAANSMIMACLLTLIAKPSSPILHLVTHGVAGACIYIFMTVIILETNKRWTTRLLYIDS